MNFPVSFLRICSAHPEISATPNAEVELVQEVRRALRHGVPMRTVGANASRGVFPGRAGSGIEEIASRLNL